MPILLLLLRYFSVELCNVYSFLDVKVETYFSAQYIDHLLITNS